MSLKGKILSIILIAITIIGCNKDEKTNVFTATTQSYSSSKVHINGKIAYWDNGDRVMINGNSYSVTIEGSGNTANIAANNVSAYDNKYYAAFPASRATMGGSSVTFDVPYSEIYSTNASGDQLVNNIMVAKSDGNQLAFENVGAMLHFKIKGSGSGEGKELLAIEVSSDQPLCGSLAVNMSGSTISSTLSGSPSDTARVLTFDTPYTLTSSAKDFYLNIPAVSGATKFRVRYMIKNGDNLEIYDKTKSGTISFVKGTMYHFGEDTYTGSNVSFNGSDGTNITPGSGDNPLRITTSDIFTASANYMGQTNRKFILDNDITVTSSVTTLKSTLDGNGHTITLGNSNSLFISIDGGTVKNLTIAGTITSPTCDNYRFGALACNVSGDASIENCVNEASVSCIQGLQTKNLTVVGGLCAYVSGGTITGCRNEGAITTDARYTGGIIGNYSSAISVSECINNETISVTVPSGQIQEFWVGGIAGNLTLTSSGMLKATNCQNNGEIIISGSPTDAIFCGGCFGQVTSSANFSIDNCSNTKDITCYTTSSGNMYFGGILGSDGGNGSSTMLNCYNEGNIGNSSIKFAGGLLGRSQRMSIQNSYAYCDLTANTVAGLVTYGSNLQTSVTISNCYYFGTMTANDNSKRFGIAGSGNSSNHFQLNYCYCPTDYSGNICGSYGTTTNCSTFVSANDASMLNLLNNHIPANGKSWKQGTNHIVFQ